MESATSDQTTTGWRRTANHTVRDLTREVLVNGVNESSGELASPGAESRGYVAVRPRERSERGLGSRSPRNAVSRTVYRWPRACRGLSSRCCCLRCHSTGPRFGPELSTQLEQLIQKQTHTTDAYTFLEPKQTPMNEIDVEAVERVADDRDAPEYVLYGGKGGVGKTTMAAATALASAREGTATLVVSTDPAHSLSDTFETEIPAEPTQIREEMPLWAVEIDPDAALEEADLFGGGDGSRESGEAGGPLGGLGGLLGGDEEGAMNPLLGGTMPGADEAAAMQQLLAYLDDDRFERVIVDTAPTGHTLRLLELPEVMDTMVGRILTLRQRLGGMMEGVKGMFGGEDGDEDGEPGMDDLEALRERIERLRATLRDPARTDFRVVMVPEEMSVMESERLLARLADFSIPVGTVVVNRVMEVLADVAPDVETAADRDVFLSPDLENCAFCKRRWEVQKDALARAQDVFRGHEVKRVPLFADEVRGEEMLAVVAACLG